MIRTFLCCCAQQTSSTQRTGKQHKRNSSSSGYVQVLMRSPSFSDYKNRKKMYAIYDDILAILVRNTYGKAPGKCCKFKIGKCRQIAWYQVTTNHTAHAKLLPLRPEASYIHLSVFTVSAALWVTCCSYIPHRVHTKG